MMEENKKVTRKRFFQIGGLLSASYFIFKNVKLPFSLAGKKSAKVNIRVNEYAVKREKRGLLHG